MIHLLLTLKSRITVFFSKELFGRIQGALEWLREVPDECNMDTWTANPMKVDENV